jgi:hypothetical protein
MRGPSSSSADWRKARISAAAAAGDAITLWCERPKVRFGEVD